MRAKNSVSPLVVLWGISCHSSILLSFVQK